MNGLTSEAAKRRERIVDVLASLHNYEGTLTEQLDALRRDIRELEDEREYIDTHGTLRP